MNQCSGTTVVRLSYLSPDVIRAVLAGRHPVDLMPTRLLRRSKDLPHDWQEPARFLNLACKAFTRIPAKRFTSDNPKMVLTDTTRLRAPHLGV